MNINSTQELMSACLATMMVCEQHEAVKDSLLGVYTIVKETENNHNISPGIDDLRKTVVENFDEMLTEIPIAPPAGFNLEEHSKCIGALLWCLRMVEIVTETESELEAMASAHDFISRMQNDSFRESNR